MKKIIKYILPIVSSATLVAPVMVSCGAYKALPKQAYEYDDDGMVIIDLNDSFRNWNKYETILIRSDIVGVQTGGLVSTADELDSIKHIQIEHRSYLENAGVSGFGVGSVGHLPLLEDIKFISRTEFPCAIGAFKGQYPLLNVLDFSDIEKYDLDIMYYKIFAESATVASTGTIYVHDQDQVDPTKAAFLIGSSGIFKNWQVKVK